MDIPVSANPSSRRRATSGRSTVPASLALSRLPSSVESPRGLVPHDSSAFSYNADFLVDWPVPEGLFKALSPSLQNAITHLRNAGAAVSTSNSRLLMLDAKRPPRADPETPPDAMSARFHEAEVQAMANPRSSPKDGEQYDTCPVPPAWRHLEQYAGMNLPMGGSRSDSKSDSRSGSKLGSKSDSPNSGDDSSSAVLMSPVSPLQSTSPTMDAEELDFRLSPALGASFPRSMTSRRDSRRESQVSARPPLSVHRGPDTPTMRRLSSNQHGSDTPSLPLPIPRQTSNPILEKRPSDPRETMYYAELWHFKSEAIARLRESYRTLKAKWLTRGNETSKTPDCHLTTTYDEAIESQFEEWLADMKQVITSWTDQAKGHTYGVNFSLGWSDNPGMDLDHPEVPL